MQLEAELVLEIIAEVGETLTVGNTPEGFLRLIPITGGTFSGKEIAGTVVPGGYDWNTEKKDGLAHVFAKYALRTDDGTYISVQNEGFLDSSESEGMIKTTPRFQVADGKYDWLRKGVMTASLEGADIDVPAVRIKVYKLG